MKYKVTKILASLGLLVLVAAQNSFAQNNSAAIAAADSTHFTVNSSGGWQMYNSYVAAYGIDSVQLEIIIQHNNNINWSEEHYVGKVKQSSLFPSASQIVVFNLISSNFELRIDSTGKCYLRLSSGVIQSNDPVVIPVKINFRK